MSISRLSSAVSNLKTIRSIRGRLDVGDNVICLLLFSLKTAPSMIAPPGFTLTVMPPCAVTISPSMGLIKTPFPQHILLKSLSSWAVIALSHSLPIIRFDSNGKLFAILYIHLSICLPVWSSKDKLDFYCIL